MTLHDMVVLVVMALSSFCLQGQVADIADAKTAFGLSGLLMWYHQPTILRVVDGDSIKISAPFLPHPLPSTLILRLRGIDTPEVGWRASCSEESQFATMATNGTEGWLQQRTTRIQLDRWDKYGGRVLGDIIDIVTSERLTDWLLAVGLALPYNGRKRPDWCAHLNRSPTGSVTEKESCAATP